MSAVKAGRSPGDGRAVGGREPCFDSLHPASYSLATFSLTYKGANLIEAHLEGASLREARLEGAGLHRAYLEGADLIESHLEGADLSEACTEGADLRLAFLNAATILNGIFVGNATGGTIAVADVRWDGVNLAVVDWASIQSLGDEQAAKGWKGAPGSGPLSHAGQAQARLDAFRDAVRANRQLATVLRDQGLNEDADRFAYRAQVLQREVFRRQRSWGRWAFSGLLALLAGYGYRLWRILVAYAVVLVTFTALYYVVGVPNGPHRTWYQPLLEAVLVSFTAVHGRVFFGGFPLLSWQTTIAGIESVFGIVIEGVFTAMLVQRFFAR